MSCDDVRSHHPLAYSVWLCLHIALKQVPKPVSIEPTWKLPGVNARFEAGFNVVYRHACNACIRFDAMNLWRRQDVRTDPIFVVVFPDLSIAQFLTASRI